MILTLRPLLLWLLHPQLRMMLLHLRFLPVVVVVHFKMLPSPLALHASLIPPHLKLLAPLSKMKMTLAVDDPAHEAASAVSGPAPVVATENPPPLLPPTDPGVGTQSQRAPTQDPNLQHAAGQVHLVSETTCCASLQSTYQRSVSVFWREMQRVQMRPQRTGWYTDSIPTTSIANSYLSSYAVFPDGSFTVRSRGEQCHQQALLGFWIYACNLKVLSSFKTNNAAAGCGETKSCSSGSRWNTSVTRARNAQQWPCLGFFPNFVQLLEFS